MHEQYKFVTGPRVASFNGDQSVINYTPPSGRMRWLIPRHHSRPGRQQKLPPTLLFLTEPSEKCQRPRNFALLRRNGWKVPLDIELGKVHAHFRVSCIPSTPLTEYRRIFHSRSNESSREREWKGTESLKTGWNLFERFVGRNFVLFVDFQFFVKIWNKH